MLRGERPDAARVFAERKASKPIPLDEMLTKTDEVRRQFARLVGAEGDEIRRFLDQQGASPDEAG